ncbi:helix-turn-helix domain-containing protein [Bacillus sp. NPDC094106]|uniref:helix-turn-helix domain-containing protein n=1 Tax=Bacillus sp. NPDC094106 TaxID=3363949 RepID=UPI00380240D9
MAIQDQWKELNEEVLKDGEHFLRDIVEAINNSLKQPQEKDIEIINNKFDAITDELKKTYKKTKYARVEKVLKTYINDIRDTVYRNKGIKLQKWDAFIIEAEKYNWQPILDLINLVKVIDDKPDDSIEEDIKQFEYKYKEDVLPYIERNLSPFHNDLAKREFNKKLKSFQNRSKKSIQDDFGALLKHLRLSRGYSLEDLGRLSDLSASYIHLLETGKRKSPTIEVVEKLASGLEVPIEDILLKMNIDISNDRTSMTGFAEMIIFKNFTLNGKKATKKQKESIVDLFNAIMKVEWTDESKMAESVELMDKIDFFKKTLS